MIDPARFLHFTMFMGAHVWQHAAESRCTRASRAVRVTFGPHNTRHVLRLLVVDMQEGGIDKNRGEDMQKGI